MNARTVDHVRDSFLVLKEVVIRIAAGQAPSNFAPMLRRRGWAAIVLCCPLIGCLTGAEGRCTRDDYRCYQTLSHNSPFLNRIILQAWTEIVGHVSACCHCQFRQPRLIASRDPEDVSGFKTNYDEAAKSRYRARND